MSEETPLIIGDAVAAETSRGPRWWRSKKAKRPPLTHCENCGAALRGLYCAECGQPAIDYHRSFGALLVEAADAFFNFDARFLTTFGLLFTKPWRLTNEFLAGRRTRFVHPLRVYLLASVVFFFLIREVNIHKDRPAPGKSPAAMVDLRKDPAWQGPPLSAAPKGAGENEGFSIRLDGEDEKKLPPFVRWLRARAEEKIGPTGGKGDLFMQAVLNNLPYMVLCSIPLFAFVLKILYLFKRRYYIEHLIFALHTHAFVFLSTTLVIGIGFLLSFRTPNLTPIVCTFLSFIILAELLIAIRRVYRQNWFATIFKFFLGSLIYTILLSLAFAATVLATLALP